MIKLKSAEQIIREEEKKQSDEQKITKKSEENTQKIDQGIKKNKDQIRLETDKNLIPQIERNLKIYLKMQKPGKTFTNEQLQETLGIKTPIEKKALDNILGYSDNFTREKSGQYGLQTNGSISSFQIAAIIVFIILIIFYFITQ